MASERLEMTLGHFVQLAGSVDREAFLRRFRDPVLLAMGVLETDDIATRSGSTSEVQIATPMSYDRDTVHPLAGQIFRLPVVDYPQGSFVIGREAPADIVVPDATVSVRHCAVSWDRMEVTVADLGSTNGTLLNLRPVEREVPVRLGDEDILTVGRQSFQFYRPLHFYRVLRSLASTAGEADLDL